MPVNAKPNKIKNAFESDDSFDDYEIDLSPFGDEITDRTIGGYLPEYKFRVYYDYDAEIWRNAETNQKLRRYKAGDADRIKPCEMPEKEKKARRDFLKLMNHPAGEAAYFGPVILDGQKVELDFEDKDATEWTWYCQKTKTRKPFRFSDLKRIKLPPSGKGQKKQPAKA